MSPKPSCILTTVLTQGESETFEATGTENLSIYRAPMEQHKLDGELAGNMRHFCKVCILQTLLAPKSSIPKHRQPSNISSTCLHT